MKAWKVGLLGVLVILLVACNKAEPAPNASPSDNQVARGPSPEINTPIPAPTAAEQAAPTAEPAAVDQSEQGPSDLAEALPPPTLLNVAWDDPTVYEAGLVEGERATLDLLAEASVYHLELTIEPGLQTVSGRQEIRYTNREETALDEVFLHLFPNLLGGAVRVSDVAVNGAPATSRPMAVPGPPLASSLASSVDEPDADIQVHVDNILGISLPRPLAPGEQTVLQMAFEVEVPAKPGNNYGVFSVVDGVLALAHFYPQVAVYDDEGWNIAAPATNADPTYADASFYLVRLNVPADQVVAASGIELSREEAGDRQVLTLAAGPTRDFYIASSDRYEVISQQAGPITVNSYGFPEFKERNQEALDIAVAALESLGRQIGPYPYTAFDIVPTVNLALGIEYPGTVALNAVLYNPDETISGTPTGIFFESTIAHEAGHQWFYNMVGNDQLDEPWLDEALTQYVTYLYYRDVYGPSAANSFRQSFLSRWERVDRAEIPIGLPAGDYSGLAYGAIVYGRGPLFFEALAEEMGPEAFEAFLKDYTQQHKWGIGTGKALRDLAETRCDCDLSALFAEWVDEP